MASGSFNIDRYGNTSTYAYFPVRWSSYSNGSAKNSSTLDVAVYIAKTTQSTQPTYGSSDTTVRVSGCEPQYENGLSFSVSPGKETLLFAKSFTVPHGEDGKRTVEISVDVGGNVAWAKGTAEITLDDIPRAAQILTATNFTDEENPTITYNNLAGETVDSVQVGILGVDGATQYARYREIPKTGTSEYIFELTDEERQALIQAVIDSNDGSLKKNQAYVRFYIKTYINGEIVDEPRYLQRIITVVNSTPDIEPLIEDIGSASTALTKNSLAMIRGFNYITASMIVRPKKGATILTRTIQNGDTIKEISEGGSAIFENSENEFFTFTVTDSFGNTIPETASIEFVDYVKLTCNLLAGSPTVNGEMAVKVSGNYFNNTFGNKGKQNALEVKCRIKKNNEEYGEWVTLTPILNGNTYEAIATITIPNHENRSVYTVQAMAKDLLNTSGIMAKDRVVRTVPVFNWGENNFDINVPVNIEGTLTVNGVLISEGSDDDGPKYGDTLPIGAVVAYDGETIPEGYEEVSEDSNRDVLLDVSEWDSCYPGLSTLFADFTKYEYVEVYFTSKGIPDATSQSGNAINNVLKIDLTKPSIDPLTYYNDTDWRYGASNFYPDAQYFVGVTTDPGFFIESAFVSKDKTKLMIGKLGYYQITNGYTSMQYSDNYERVSKVVGVKKNALATTAYVVDEDSIFSTEERIVGTWFDNRPIYRKDYIINVPKQSTRLDTALGVTNIDMVWLDGESFIQTTSGASKALNTYESDSAYIRTAISGGYIRINPVASDYFSGTAYVIVKYIKTTD